MNTWYESRGACNSQQLQMQLEAAAKAASLLHPGREVLQSVGISLYKEHQEIKVPSPPFQKHANNLFL